MSIRVIIPANTSLSHGKDDITLNEDITYGVSSGTRVKIGSNIFVLVDDYISPRILSQLLEVELFRIQTNRRLELAAKTRIKYNTISLLIDDELDVVLPEGCPIKLPAQTKLQQHDKPELHLMLTDECNAHLLSYDYVLTEAKAKEKENSFI